jgi:DNA-binding beta-propeller fold protein YncE
MACKIQKPNLTEPIQPRPLTGIGSVGVASTGLWGLADAAAAAAAGVAAAGVVAIGGAVIAGSGGGACSCLHCDANCICDAGWDGARCDNKKCEMSCGAHGKCVKGQCECNVLYDGPDCSSTICKNGGTPGPTGTCVCVADKWTGDLCQTPVCATTCQHGGTCSSPNTCTCVNGYAGEQCQTAICASACLNGGTCSSPNTCTCAAGWTGGQCQLPVCDDACKNGTCSKPNTCSCAPGWTGDTCDTCAAAFYCSSATNDPPAEVCPGGAYCPQNSARPMTCPVGFFCPRSSAETTICPAGTYCPEKPNVCPPFQIGRPQPFCKFGNSEPVPCRPGSYCPAAGAGQSLPCPAGSYCPDAGMIVPLPCPAGSCCPDAGMVSPLRCENGGTCAADNTCTCTKQWTGAQCTTQVYACVDTGRDSQNCGECGVSCPAGYACDNGACRPACAAGSQACPGENWCIDTLSNAQNCGACGNACQPGQLCVTGVCVTQCPTPSVMCNQQCSRAGNAMVRTLHQFTAEECIGVVGVSEPYNNTFIVTVQPFNDAEKEVYQMYRMSIDGLTITPIGSRIRGNTDGSSAQAQFNNPRSLALDPATGNVYVADMKNRAIRMVDVNNNVSTVSQESDGLANPYGLAFFNGDLFVLDTGYEKLFKIELSKGDSTARTFCEFSAGEAPYVVGVDKNGFVYVTLLGNRFQNVMKLGPDGTRLGLLTSFFSSIQPTALAVDALLNVYVADGNGTTNGIYMVSQPSQTVTLIAGGGAAGNSDGVGQAAQFWRPWSLAFTPNNDLLVADWMNNSVRIIQQCST